MFSIRLSRVLGASILGLALLAGMGIGAVLRDPVTREPALGFLDKLHVYGPRTRIWRQARALAARDAAQDASRAFAAGDARLLGVAGLGSSLPGTAPSDYLPLSDKFGVRFLSSGCAVSSEEERFFRQTEDQYAARYNQALLSLAAGRIEVERHQERDTPVTSSVVSSWTPQTQMSGFQPPVLIHRPGPDWQRFPSGHVPAKGGVYRLAIDEKGDVVRVEVIRAAHPRVDGLMLETLLEWRFLPATREGQAVASDYTMTLSINVR